jgi:LAO/AO transport system ATPase
MLDALLERFHRRDRLALSRLLSLVARGECLREISTGLRAPARPSRVVTITGSAGVGKSTLIGQLIEWLRRQEHTVAVLACDPQSPLSGGALLGDRFRMPASPQDEEVFIRSLAAVAGNGAVAEHLDLMLRLLESFGFEVIFIETVGAGQGDTAARELADVLVLLLQPETGDDLQWEKAGVLEVADVIAIHKADLPQAEMVESQVRGILALSAGMPVPILRVSAKSGKGIEELWTAIATCPLRRVTHEEGGRDLLEVTQKALAGWFQERQTRHEPEVAALLARWHKGTVTDEEAAAQLLGLYQRERNPELSAFAKDG